MYNSGLWAWERKITRQFKGGREKREKKEKKKRGSTYWTKENT
jgi:hypothetical protein